MNKAEVKAKQHESYNSLTIISFLLPFVGILIGIVYLTKDKVLDRKLGEHLVAISILFCILWGIGFASFGSSLFKTPAIYQPAGSTPVSSPTTTVTSSAESGVPADYKSALAQANTYSNTMHLSKKGVYDQLVSEYGGKFKPDAAQYAVDNVKADWNANALAQARTYQNDLHLSTSAVHDQLVSDYGGKFTQSEADYAIQHL